MSIMGRFLSSAVLNLIRFYQYFLSPLFGQRCRFYPTCSSYTYKCFQLFPFHLALWYAVKRLIKCHPFSRGGFDPPPEKLCDKH